MSRGLGKWQKYILEHVTEDWTYLHKIFQKAYDEGLLGLEPGRLAEQYAAYDDDEWLPPEEDPWRRRFCARWGAFLRASSALRRRGLIRRRAFQEFVKYPLPITALKGNVPRWNRRSIQIRKA